jgi:hypothetical protein
MILLLWWPPLCIVINRQPRNGVWQTMKKVAIRSKRA